MTAAWVVVIEAAGSSNISIGAVRRMMELMADSNPTTLYSPDRYALQVVIRAPSPDEALSSALALWREGQERLDLEGWDLARAEVITLAEFEYDTSNRSRTGKSLVSTADEEELEELLLRRAYHDAITGLANRDLFLDHLQHALRRSERADGRLALLLFEVDEYAVTADRPGDEIRDAILAEVADRLIQGLRRGDSVGRIGNGLFGVLLEDVSEVSAFFTGSRLLDALRASMTVGTSVLVVPTSFGLAVSEPGDGADALLLKAETALHRGEEGGIHGRHPAVPHVLEKQEHLPRRARVVEHRDSLAQLRLLQASAEASSECASLESAARLVLRQACAQMVWPLGHLYLVADESPRRLVPASVWNPQASQRFREFQLEVESSSEPPDIGLPERVLAEGRSRWTSYVGANAHLPRAQAAVRAGLAAGFAVPVVVRNEVAAVLEFFTDEATAPGDSMFDVMATVGMQLGRVIERARATADAAGTRAQLRELAGFYIRRDSLSA